jgi:hypothetical protein
MSIQYNLVGEHHFSPLASGNDVFFGCAFIDFYVGKFLERLPA